MADRDYYDILGVGRGVGEEDIRKAFRKKAMEFHPDRNKSAGAEDKFKEINEAYQVLSDSNKRAQYDRFGKAGVGANSGSGQPFDGFDGFGGFGDIFDSFFGSGSGRRQQAQRGSDLQHRVVLSFEESVLARNVRLISPGSRIAVLVPALVTTRVLHWKPVTRVRATARCAGPNAACSASSPK